MERCNTQHLGGWAGGMRSCNGLSGVANGRHDILWSVRRCLYASVLLGRGNGGVNSLTCTHTHTPVAPILHRIKPSHLLNSQWLPVLELIVFLELFFIAPFSISLFFCSVVFLLCNNSYIYFSFNYSVLKKCI